MQIYSLRNAHGCEARITDLGGIVLSLTVPDRSGQLADVVLGFDRPEDYRAPAYVASGTYFGALIGRYANRIARGKFRLAGQPYHLATNNGPNHLHGGARGFDQRRWQATPVATTPEGEALALRYVSADGEEGYPGTLTVKAVYTLTERNELKLTFEATASQQTILNLTHHSYFNLRGAGNGDILDHRVMLAAERFTPIDATSIPEGPLRPVEGTPFDFRRPAAIRARLGEPDEQLARGHGYDHNFAVDFDPGPGAAPRLIARVTEPGAGRTLEVESTYPGVQFYTGNFLDGTLTGKGGVAYARRSGFCLEPQHFPDAPNRPDFLSPELRPGELYQNTMVYRFGVEGSEAPR